MTIPARILFAAALCAASLAGQKTEIARVRASPKTPGAGFMAGFGGGMLQRAGRVELHGASIAGMIRAAWGMDLDRIVGGPSWVELDRFDVIAKLPDHADPAAISEMLKALLADRFKLVVHEGKQPMPAYALTAGKKLSMKQSDASGDTGCRIQQRDASPSGGGSMLMTSIGGVVTRIALGPGDLIQYACRNMSMDSFAQELHRMVGSGVGNKFVLNQTGVDGKWDFDLHFSLGTRGGPNGEERVSLQEAIEKQLGLKLIDISMPMPVLTIDSVERTPTPDPPGAAEALPPLESPAAFDVATIRPSDPEMRGGMTSMNKNRFTAENVSLQSLVLQAFRTSNVPFFNSDAVVGIPGFADSARYNITATAGSPEGAADLPLMMRALLEERFKMKWHNEERPMNAYTLVAARPKMKKADPASRSHCIRGNGAAGSPPASQTITCQNMTMDDFVDQLQGMGSDLNWPVRNSTGLEGGWDFTLTYGRGPASASPAAPLPGGGEGRSGAAVADAADPGGTLTLVEAIEKQLGLKLEIQKRPEAVVVIDHLEEKPTEN
jgi:uncharacterized protein (TIGR03435 family)